MNSDERNRFDIDRLRGEMTMLSTVLQLMTAIHPDREAIARELETGFERMISDLLPQPVPDAALHALQATRDAFLAVARSTSPPAPAG